jgi:hypothetical protein
MWGVFGGEGRRDEGIEDGGYGEERTRGRRGGKEK